MSSTGRVSREAHARFYERLGVKSPGATRPLTWWRSDGLVIETAPPAALKLVFRVRLSLRKRGKP